MKRGLIIFTIILLNISVAFAQDAKYKALFIYNFTKQIEWPESEKSGDFVICVVNHSELYNQLVTITNGKKVGNQNIIIKKLKGIEEVEKCHILFLSTSSSSGSNMESILSKIGNNSATLIVTERSGMTTKGACINFLIQEDKIKFELSKSNASQRGLKISSYLENIAILIN
jgi:hypothetical protein